MMNLVANVLNKLLVAGVTDEGEVQILSHSILLPISSVVCFTDGIREPAFGQ